jgi:diacylglycerol kinase (ATP)
MVGLEQHSHRSDGTRLPRLAFVLNGRASGVDDPERLALDLASRAQELGAAARARVTFSESELWEELREAAENGERVVLVGGDGSLHAAANAPLRDLPELALIPAGRANNIARALGIPIERASALELAVQARPRSLDALSVRTPDTSLYAIEGVSAGFHADARSRYDAENSSDTRQGLGALIAALREFTPYRLSAQLDHEQVDSADAAQLFLSNLPYFGFGFHVAPGADPSDGLLDAVVFRTRRRTGLLRLLAAAYRGRHVGRRGVRRVAARRAEITAPLPIVADAVPLGTTTATVTVEPARLQVAAPAAGGES